LSFYFKKSSQEIKNIKDKKKKKTTYKRSQIREKEIGRQKQKGEKTKKKRHLICRYQRPSLTL
jgi:hypothetical protein